MSMIDDEALDIEKYALPDEQIRERRIGVPRKIQKRAGSISSACRGRGLSGSPRLATSSPIGWPFIYSISIGGRAGKQSL
jgi:hypothetical protein